MKKLMFLFLALSLAAGGALAKDALEKPLVPFPDGTRATESEPNDNCVDSDALFIGDPMDAAIDPADDYDWFEITVQAGECVIFETHPGDAGDTKLYLFDSLCSTQLAFDDDGGEGLYSLIEYTFDEAGTYHLVVMHYSSTGTGTYVLTAENCPEPMENDTCDGAIPLPDGPIDFQVDLCLYNDDYSPGAYGNSCTGYSANGSDAVYLVTLVPGGTIEVCEDAVNYADLAIYLITDCADPEASCVAGDDSGNPECITYTSENGGDYYLIIDAYSGCDLVNVTGLITNPTATQSSDWGTVKALY